MSATGGGGQEEDKKPTDQHINLKVKGQVYIFMFIRVDLYKSCNVCSYFVDKS